MRLVRTYIIPLVFLFFLGIFATKSLATPGLFTSHDSELHITRMMEFHQALLDGQFPPQWAGKFFHGLGSPVLLLNYQLPYAISEIFLRLGLSYINAYKLVLGGSYIVSGLFAYIAFSKIFSQKSALVGAMLYTWAPYRFVDIYVRGAFGESFVFMFPPIILLGIHKKSLVLVALGFVGLSLSHPVAAALYTLLFFGYAAIYAYTNFRGKQGIVFLRTFVFGFLLAISISAFSILPTLALTQYTHYSPKNSLPLQNFPTIRQLIKEYWGFGGSTIDDNDGMSFQIGYPQIFAAALVPIIVTGLCFVHRKRSKELLAFVLPAYIMLCLYISLFFLLPTSTSLWKLIQLDKIIDFPWRILLMVVFLTSYLGGWVVSKVSYPSSMVLAVFLILLSIRTNITHIHINNILPWNEDHYLQKLGTGDAYGEYAAIWRDTQFGIPERQRVEILDGTGNLQITQNISQRIEAVAKLETQATIRMNVMYFPGWQIWINQVHQGFASQCFITRGASQYLPNVLQNTAQEVAEDYSGLMECRFQAGTYTIRAEFVPSLPQMLGNLLSCAGIATFLWITYRSFFPPITSRRTSSKWSRPFHRS